MTAVEQVIACGERLLSGDTRAWDAATRDLVQRALVNHADADPALEACIEKSKNSWHDEKAFCAFLDTLHASITPSNR